MSARFSDSFDFENCEDEPIRTPGSIQSFGALRLLDRDSLRCVLQSTNAAALFAEAFAGISPTPESGLPPACHGQLVEHLGSTGSPWPLRCLQATADRQWHITIHPCGQDLLMVELEPGEAGRPTAVADLAGLIQQIRAARGVSELMGTAAGAVRGITGFDRTLVYRFAEDWHGEVMAESRDPAMPSFLGLHFPASDIPAQARALYQENEIRLIADVDSPVLPLEPVPGPEQGRRRPDLSQCSLRAVSPIHLQYLRNMGVRASLSISVIREGRLWGLIACHNRTPCHVSLDARLAAKLVGDVLSLCLRLVEEADVMRDRMQHTVCQREILEHFVESDELVPSLMANASALRSLFGATGFAVVDHGRISGDGLLPEDGDLLLLADNVRKRMMAGQSSLFCQNGWPEPAFEAQAETAAGVMALAPTTGYDVLVLWLRVEEPREVVWAGRDDKAPDDPLNPRHSFEQWSELRRGVARPWVDWELEAAGEMLVALQKLGLRQLARVQRLALNLERSNRDLEDFAFIASHDLQEPLRKVEAFSSLILEELGRPDLRIDEVRGYVSRVTKAASRLRSLVSDLLTYSRVGRLDYQFSECDWQDIARETVELLDGEIVNASATVQLAGDFPVTQASPVLLRMVLQNLISNALKYRADDGRAVRIEVVSSRQGEGWRLDVIDNGIGFEPEQAEVIFKPFHRLNSKTRYPGSGIGLAIVRKAAERLGASVVAVSTPGQGSRFSVTYPAPPSISEG